MGEIEISLLWSLTRSQQRCAAESNILNIQVSFKAFALGTASLFILEFSISTNAGLQ